MEANRMTFAFLSNWRGAESYRYVRDLDRAGFAWELLRRNPDYCSVARDTPLVRPVGGYLRIDAAPRHGPRWGLSFRASG
ncbi:hypothetical protein CA223_19030 [Sphingomonas koreensis]|jgi:hypothetical protein|uniref:Transcriptional regulator-like domain-containing protein n=2 Tax=Sphingomonas koreensis TaxID=93064 RepID=A0A1L6J5J4_9SPHN|nr:hypothetical protein BRX40_00800 [Sphingomonas koreensis]RSU17097.1 hypothetical protein CA224_22895 [Sphingomonas koreensis]RSU20057.1 hypothetical protein CA225_23040 [Sphingomonas koreensis]RSU22013.1 hypothetical protein CA222_18920 [Sphingomonas koreensis]RSU31728.1 hypothetical protein BRX39_17185 [Sphingomonas koreensis]